MKPVPFGYHVPKTIEDAVALLHQLPEARVLAGGQSLVPMLNLRAVAPSHLIDLGRIPALSGIEETADGLSVGAMTTQRQIEHSAIVSTHCPLMTETIKHVGHQQTRNRGTIGGSLCHLDFGAELPVAAAALEAVLTVQGPDGTRSLGFADFPAGYLTTALEPGEILTQVKLRKRRRDEGYAFLEFNQRPADFAVVSVAVLMTLEGDRAIDVKIALGGVSFAPIRLAEVEAALRNKALDHNSLAAAAAIAKATDCVGDEVSPPEYRQHLAGVLVRRALRKAADRAKGRST